MRNLSGQRFGMWTVVGFSGGFENKAPLWTCRCDCGVERTVRSTRLMAGKSNGCGCRRYDKVRTHGQTRSPTYMIWRSMILRTESKGNASYKHYGAKGIKVCERWRHDFAAFLADMGERPDGMSIDRIDNSRDYEPENCRWASTKEQARHRAGIKLDETKAAEIRALYATGLRQQDIAERYGVNRSLISTIVNGHCWR